MPRPRSSARPGRRRVAGAGADARGGQAAPAAQQGALVVAPAADVGGTSRDVARSSVVDRARALFSWPGRETSASEATRTIVLAWTNATASSTRATRRREGR